MPHCCTSGVETFRLLEFCSAGQISKGSNTILKTFTSHIRAKTALTKRSRAKTAPHTRVTGENCPTHTLHGRKLPHTYVPRAKTALHTFHGRKLPHTHESRAKLPHTYVTRAKTAPHTFPRAKTALDTHLSLSPPKNTFHNTKISVTTTS